MIKNEHLLLSLFYRLTTKSSCIWTKFLSSFDINKNLSTLVLKKFDYLQVLYLSQVEKADIQGCKSQLSEE